MIIPPSNIAILGKRFFFLFSLLSVMSFIIEVTAMIINIIIAIYATIIFLSPFYFNNNISLSCLISLFIYVVLKYFKYYLISSILTYIKKSLTQYNHV